MADLLFIVTVGPGDTRRLDRLTDELADELREISGVRVGTATTAGSPGTKSGTAIEVGQLLVSGGALGTTAWAIRDIVLRFLARGRAESVTVRNGDRRVTIVRPTDGQVDDLVDQLRGLLADD
ncbi:hypothetical protein DFR70_104647 [Nocardia tenerifensis]|uniref:Uncharacterized protein n=1 Tax=Nocardia tenerifensis TaxID=228006 RepID=A0A318K7C4_9NOCA|nr:hypothetical protein [Nocardia tenerifensis]PXX65582.1 hypothetical protein DFR70_104647 [Nocardia tenerifensis]